MPSVLDLWRAIDPHARLLAGDESSLRRPVLGVERTRAAPPHLPVIPPGSLLLADVALLQAAPLDALMAGVTEAGLEPSAILLAGARGSSLERLDSRLPVIASTGDPAPLLAAAQTYLADEAATLASAGMELRLAFAEAALADPDPASAAGLAATRLRRGTAVAVAGNLRSLHARAAGRALAARFTAIERRLLAPVRPGSRRPIERRLEGIWVLEGPISDDASAWLFDDLPMAAIDRAALDALVVTLRALLRRPEASRGASPARRTPAQASTGPLTGIAEVDATLLAVARSNGRVTPAARALGVHRNTVLYRLRRGMAEIGLDPRRPDDAWRILQRGGHRTASEG